MMLYVIIKSILVISLVASCISWFAYSINMDPIPVFIMTIVVQILLYNIYRAITDRISAIKMREIQLQEIKNFNMQGLELSCAHCRHTTFAPIRFDQVNSFSCPECNKPNAVYLNVTVAQETTPLDMESITTKLLIDEEQRVKDSILTSDKK